MAAYSTSKERRNKRKLNRRAKQSKGKYNRMIPVTSPLEE